MIINTNLNVKAVFGRKGETVHSRAVTAFDEDGVAYVTENKSVKDMTGKANLVRVDSFSNFLGLTCHGDGDNDVIGSAPAEGWRYARDVEGEDGRTRTYPVDVFLVRANGDLTPVAYDGETAETTWLEMEGDVVILRTEEEWVSRAEHFGELEG